MSVMRRTNTSFNLRTLKEVCERLGYTVEHNTTVCGWSGVTLLDENKKEVIADMVISNDADTYDIGLVDNNDNSVTLIVDEHGGYVKNKLKQILPAYIEAELDGRFIIEEQTVDKNQLKIFITR